MKLLIVVLFTALSVCLLVGIETEVVRAQMAQRAPTVERQRVVPVEVIERFRLQPVEGKLTPYVLGEDGRPYSLDEVMDALFELTADRWRRK